MHSSLTPLLKKPGLDTSDMANFRPVSNLSFMSKVVEKAVSTQLNEYLMDQLGSIAASPVGLQEVPFD